MISQVRAAPKSCSKEFVCQVAQDQCAEDQDCHGPLQECCDSLKSRAYAECIPNDNAFRSANQKSMLCSTASVCGASKSRKIEPGSGFFMAGAVVLYVFTALPKQTSSTYQSYSLWVVGSLIFNDIMSVRTFKLSTTPASSDWYQRRSQQSKGHCSKDDCWMTTNPVDSPLRENLWYACKACFRHNLKINRSLLKISPE